MAHIPENIDFSAHLRTLVGQLEDLTMKDVETRLTHWLVQRCPDALSEKPAGIELKTAKRVLAVEPGTVGETFSRTLAKFRKQPHKLGELHNRNLGEKQSAPDLTCVKVSSSVFV